MSIIIQEVCFLLQNELGTLDEKQSDCQLKFLTSLIFSMRNPYFVYDLFIPSFELFV